MSSATFDYRAVDHTGRTIKGRTVAASRDAVLRRLRGEGLTPVAVLPATGGAGVLRGKGVRTRDIVQFTRQLGVLLTARFPLSEALSSIAEQEEHPAFRDVVFSLAAKVQSGSPLASALREHQAAFGDVYLEAVHAAEQSGNLVKVLDHLSDLLERSEETRRQVRGALMYPACVCGTLFLAVGFLITFAVPKFATMFAQRGVDLPILTRVLIAVGNSVRDYWFVYALAAVGAWFGARAALRRAAVRRRVERAADRVPVVSEVLRGLAISRFARVLGICLSSGLSLMDSLAMSGRASGRGLMDEAANSMAGQVRSGGQFSVAVDRSGYLPKFARRMLAAGEKSGELPRMCDIIASHYERECSALVKTLGTLIEPVLIVMIAASVLVVALAIFLPMWDLVTLVG
jgi:general secretion pathway protein F